MFGECCLIKWHKMRSFTLILGGDNKLASSRDLSQHRECWVISETSLKWRCCQVHKISSSPDTIKQNQLLRHTLDDFALVNLVYPNITDSRASWRRQLAERSILNVDNTSFTTGRHFYETAVAGKFDLEAWVEFCEANWVCGSKKSRKLFLSPNLSASSIRCILWEHLYSWIDAIRSEIVEFRHS